ncbi:hypothetical protein [Tenacibaculum maritimum]|uniref:hypothetical protein n=1 Tax=Tenacibaculum maritimum TaxID=107401 RepID=UPI001E5D2798|nr:hypothetical protein [Tenacibaculum maritimum]MCD9586160.1 hypothetical protein [Tenacibaculum maritimum]MCD9622120.1 hypothetical protein [Tenacibaculum maritimum]MCD9628518.1 hypothetical protein [Tenacibaculum maritimum]MCD9631415.1 hypothetical protein [Tenacibaculum maritimum]MCD9634272.1 hypothetical protein [Tenacibaculum maritimum]
MKRITLLCCFILTAVLTYAQQEINTSFTNQMNTLFGQLDKTKIPDGILLDYGMEFTNLAEFNGTLTTKNYVTLGRLEEIYKTLLTSKINPNTNTLVNPTVFKNNLKTHRTKGIIALTGLYYKYSKFKDIALSKNLITYSNGKFYDNQILSLKKGLNKLIDPNNNGGTLQTPYETKQTFAITPAIQKYSGLNLQVKIPSAIFYSNYTNQVQSIQIDFNNGNGYVTIPFNQNIAVNYTTEGVKTWKYKLNLTNGTNLYSHSKIKIEKGYETYAYGSQNQQRTNSNGAARYPFKRITATDSYSGKKASVNLTIDLAYGHRQIKKPLIVAEGFDPGILLSPENEYGYTNYQKDFKKSIETGGSQLYNLIEGYNKQYDIIYIDWDNGVDYLQRNAYALEEVIKWVNQQKASAGSTEPNVVLGQSMGGVIGRWALADMEERGLNHDTRLFISHDAPQQGANVPVAVQYMYRHMDNLFIKTPAGYVVSLFSDVDNYFSLLDTPAARQLLKNRAKSNYALENYWHSSFYTELKNKGLNGSGGYPVNSRNIAISNGSECGSTQNFVAGDYLFKYNYNKKLSFLQNLFTPFALSFAGVALFDIDILGAAALSYIPGSSRFKVDFWTKSIPYGTGNQIYKGKISYTKKILWLVSITTNITNKNKNQPNGVLPFDNYGGGYYPVTKNIDLSLLPKGIYLRDKFSFISTASALDIGKNNVNLYDTDYLRSYVGGNPPTGTKSSPFINFSSDFDTNPNISNKPHISFNPRNGDWLASELLGGNNVKTTDCAAFCSNTAISGRADLCTSRTYSVTSSATTVNWWISEGANLVTTAVNNNQITLTLNNANSQSNNIVLNVTYKNSDCGQVTASKTIKTGKPSYPNQEMIGDDYVYNGQYKNYSVPIAEGATEYHWYFDYGGTTSDDGSPAGAWEIQSGQGTRTIFVKIGNINRSVVAVCKASNTCGNTIKYMYVTLGTTGNGGGSEPCDELLRLSSNPMKSDNLAGKIIWIEDPCDKNLLRSKSTNKTRDYKIEIFDKYQRLIYTKTQKIPSFDLNKLGKGFFIIRYQTKLGNIITKKLLVE